MKLDKEMLALQNIRQSFTHVRCLSGTPFKRAGIPPGYTNIYLTPEEMPAPLPKGPLTPELRAKLAAKYNMRAEDYRPCAWDPTYARFGDYPQLNFQNGDELTPNHDWDEFWWRRNYGEPISVDVPFQMVAMPDQSENPIFGHHFDNRRHWWSYIWGMHIIFWIYWAEEWYFRRRGMGDTYEHGRKGDFYEGPYHFEDNFRHTHMHFMDSYNDGYRYLGYRQNAEGDRFERWGVRYANNLCPPGWEDLDKTPGYAHQW